MRGSQQFQISLLTANVLLALSAWSVVALAAPLDADVPEIVSHQKVELKGADELWTLPFYIYATSDSTASSTFNSVSVDGVEAYEYVELQGGKVLANGSNINATASSNILTINQTSIIETSLWMTGGEVRTKKGDSVFVGEANKNQVFINESLLNVSSGSIRGALINAVDRFNGSIFAKANENSITFNGFNELTDFLIAGADIGVVTDLGIVEVQVNGNQVTFNDGTEFLDSSDSVSIFGAKISASSDEDVRVQANDNAIVFNQDLGKYDAIGKIKGVTTRLNGAKESQLEASNNEVVFNNEVDIEEAEINGVDVGVYPTISGEESANVAVKNNAIVFNRNATFDEYGTGGSIVGVSMDVQKTLEAVIDVSENQIVFNGEVEIGPTAISGVRIEPMESEGSVNVKVNNNSIVFNQDVSSFNRGGGSVVGVSVGVDPDNTLEFTPVGEFIAEASNNQVTFNESVKSWSIQPIVTAMLISQGTDKAVAVAQNNQLAIGADSDLYELTLLDGGSMALSTKDALAMSSGNIVTIEAGTQLDSATVVSGLAYGILRTTESGKLHAESLDNHIRMEAISGDASARAGIALGMYSGSVTTTLKANGNSVEIFDSEVDDAMAAVIDVRFRSEEATDFLGNVTIEAQRNQVLVSDDSKVSGQGVVGVSLGMNASSARIPFSNAAMKNAVVNISDNQVIVSDSEASAAMAVGGRSVGQGNISNNTLFVDQSKISYMAFAVLMVDGEEPFAMALSDTESSTVVRPSIHNNQLILRNATVDGMAGAVAWIDPSADSDVNFSDIGTDNKISLYGHNTVGELVGFNTLALHVEENLEDKPILTLTGERMMLRASETVSLSLENRSLEIHHTGDLNSITTPLIATPDGSLDMVFNENSTVRTITPFVERQWDPTQLTLGEDGTLTFADFADLTPVQTATDHSNLLGQVFYANNVFLAQGTEVVADSAMRAASESAQMGSNGAFGVIEGGLSRYDIGRNVDVDGVNLVTGVTRVFDATMLAGFIEVGMGFSDEDISIAKGETDHNYYGLGVMAKHRYASGIYSEASLRAGYSSSDFSGHLGGAKVDFETRGLYASAHVGGGYEWALSDAMKLDVYGRYSLTYMDSDTVNVADVGNAKLKAEGTDTHAMRIGARLVGTPSERLSWRTGLAYEHVFDTNVKPQVDGVALKSYSMEGDIGMVEAAMTLTPATGSPWSVDMGVKGYIGDREGVTGNVSVRYSF